MAKPSLEKSLYLQTIGNVLDENIEIFWTGPRVISRRLTSSHLSIVNQIFRRRVTIWDNLNANDYDQRRLCLGPFSGRSSTLSSLLSGMLINPNCEFELNFIPLNTLGQWFQSIQIHSNQNQIDDNDNDNDHDDRRQQQENDSFKSIYHYDQCLTNAIHQWLTEFHKVKSSFDSSFPLKVS